MAGKAYITRMGMGFPGAITRQQDLTTEPAILDAAKPFVAYGLAGKYKDGKFVPLEAGDTVADVVGAFVRPYPTHNPTDVRSLGVTAGYTGDVLKRGYMCVAVPSAQAASATKGAPVYVRVAAATENSPLGAFLLAPDATAANTPKLPDVTVMGAGDDAATATHGNVEIAYNI
ncbi:structural cement protein Gp24 [Mixta intestinalis]|uniref:Bacteriophage protein n=1 Tax=Mixta intestinalis TaxID=1615494 RepID=A0A6P1Q0D0_9GAMM|nr:hypothetical protein [Mixta intestinalis]QHM71285.1 hypothetical protein C7M51_01571 [Mixta intestinalis]